MCYELCVSVHVCGFMHVCYNNVTCYLVTHPPSHTMKDTGVNGVTSQFMISTKIKKDISVQRLHHCMHGLICSNSNMLKCNESGFELPV